RLPARLPTAAPAAAAPLVTAPAAAAAATVATTAVSPAAETARALRARTCLVDREVAPAERIVVKLLDRLLCVLVRPHLAEPESARPPRGHIAHHLHCVDRAGRGDAL